MVPKSKPEWFLAPRNIAPDTTIGLGKLIADPRVPGGPPYLTSIPINDDETPIRQITYPYSRSDHRGKGGKLGVFASFLSAIVGVGGDLSGELQLTSTQQLDVERLEVTTFEPDHAYLERLLNAPANLAELIGPDGKRRRATKRLYVITGIQIARGATVTLSSSREWKGEVSVSVNPAVPIPTPIEVGPSVGGNRSKGVEEHLGKHDFVYAFKLNKVLYRDKTGDVLGQEWYTKGAAFGEEDPRMVEVSQPSHSPRVASVATRGRDMFEVTDLQLQDAGRNEFGVQGEEVEDDDGDGAGTCIVIEPSTITDDSEDEDENEDE